MPSVKHKVAVLTGPTSSGKSSIAMELALKNGKIEIINADSLLVYRGLDIGTAKPSARELKQVPHHLIDIRDPHEPFTAGDFFRLVTQTILEIQHRGNRPLIVGGTGFYLKALLYGLWQAPKADPKIRAKYQEKENIDLYRQLLNKDAESALRIGKNDRYRLIRALELIEMGGKTPSELREAETRTPDPRFEIWVIDRPNEILNHRIEARTEAMIKSDFIGEVERIRAQYQNQEPPRPLSAVGYNEVCKYLDGILPAGRKIAPGLEGLKSEINLATRQLVKSQRTWFRGQKSVHWFELDRDLALLKSAWSDLYDAGF